MIEVTALVPGEGQGRVVVLDRPLSFWGGFDPATGEVIDRRHPQLGVRLSGAVVAMPGGRGSSSATSVITEAIRIGTAPAAFVLARPDPIIALGAMVAEELYSIVCPVVVVPEAPSLLSGWLLSGWEWARVTATRIEPISARPTG